jgi:quercetin dioxygenase-like cupin family protein
MSVFIGDAMELIRSNELAVLRNTGVESKQLLTQANSSSTRLTITRVVMTSGSINPRHAHTGSEQVWIALSGEATLLLGDGRTQQFGAGDVVRFSENDIHGAETVGKVPFEYIAVTTPPIDFSSAYRKDWSAPNIK